MKIANISNEACIVVSEGRACRIGEASEGRFGPTMDRVLASWDAFSDWAKEFQAKGTFDYAETDLCCVSPDARQVFAIGLNYDAHSKETGIAAGTDFPPVFPKWPSSLCDPFESVSVPSESHVDWEVELVVVIGRGGRDIRREDAIDHIAGYSIGQDFSDRKVQFVGDAPQFGLGKSFKNFSPTGPFIVTPDEFGDPSGKAITCEVDGETKQSGTLDQMIFPVAEIVSILSGIVELTPGDLIFTGTPSGVGFARKPQEFLQPGSKVTSTIEGIGQIHQTVVSR